MSERDIRWNLPLVTGRGYEAAWWMFHRESIGGMGTVYHGIDLLRVKMEPVRDLFG